MTKKVEKVSDGSIFAHGNITIDEINQEFMPGGLINLAKTWSVFIPSKRISLVTKIGDDFYGAFVEKELRAIKIDGTYVRKVKGAPTKRNRVIGYFGQNPVLSTVEEADMLNKTPHKRISLESASLLFYQSFSAIFESSYVNMSLRTLQDASRKQIPTVLDMNTRSVSVEKVKQDRGVVDAIHKVLDSLDTLKVNESELGWILYDFNIEGPIEQIHFKKKELIKAADSVYDSYNFKKLVVTCGERGSYLQDGEKGLLFESLRLQNFRNSLGCGDAFSAGYCLKYFLALDDIEAVALGTVLGALLTLEKFAYPKNIGKESVLRTIDGNRDFLVDNGINDVDWFTSRLNDSKK